MRGWIDKKTYKKYEDENQKLNIGGGSWTINIDEVGGKDIENVEYITNKHKYRIDFNEARTKGFTRLFQGEPKLVVPIKYWEECDD